MEPSWLRELVNFRKLLDWSGDFPHRFKLGTLFGDGRVVIRKTNSHRPWPELIRRLFVFLFVLLPVVSAFSQEVEPIPDPAKGDQSYYEAVWETWLEECNGKGDYSLMMAIVEGTPNDVLDSVNVNPDMEVKQGTFVKHGPFVRLDVTPPPDLQFQEALLPDGSKGFQGVPSAFVVSRDVQISHFYDPIDGEKRLRDSVAVQPRDEVADRPYVVSGGEDVLSPFSMGLHSLGLFELPVGEGETGEVEFRNVKRNPTLRRLRIQRKDGDGRHFLKEIDFDVSESFPKLVLMRFEMRNADGELDAGSLVKCDDFRACDPHPIPAFLRQVLYRTNDPKVVVRDWRSEHLGEESPTHDDLLLVVPKDIKIRGLKVLPASQDGMRTIDIASISRDGMFEGTYAVRDIVDGDSLKAAPAGKSAWVWLLLVNLIILSVFGGLMYLRKGQSSA